MSNETLLLCLNSVTFDNILEARFSDDDIARRSLSLLLAECFRRFPRSVSLFRGTGRRYGETSVVMQFSTSTGNYSVMTASVV
jgi:hypothetical protein